MPPVHLSISPALNTFSLSIASFFSRYGQNFGAPAAAAGSGEIVMPTKAEAEPSFVQGGGAGGEAEVASSEQLTEEEEKALQMLGQKNPSIGGGGYGFRDFGGRGGRGGALAGMARGGRGDGGGGYGSAFTCKRCGRPGHFAANCPSKNFFTDTTIRIATQSARTHARAHTRARCDATTSTQRCDGVAS